MMRRMAAALAVSMLPASGAVAAPAISEAAAAQIVDRTEAAWASTDAAKVKALYAPTIVGFDLAAPPLATDRATWDKLQDALVAARLDRMVETKRRIQLLGADMFVLSGTGDISSSAIPADKFSLRYTDVFQRQPDGGWLIVNDHVSVAPAG